MLGKEQGWSFCQLLYHDFEKYLTALPQGFQPRDFLFELSLEYREASTRARSLNTMSVAFKPRFKHFVLGLETPVISGRGSPGLPPELSLCADLLWSTEPPLSSAATSSTPPVLSGPRPPRCEALRL
jgi:hypothetical protein